MTRKLSRIQALIAGGAFAVAGVFGTSAAALAADTQPVVTTEQAAITQAAPAAPETAAPSAEQLHPVGISAEQKRFTPDAEQITNAKAIVDAGKAMGLSPRAWTIAVATSLQESNLRNIGHLGANNDHDSQGLFQQRPSSGWGTPEQITDPSYASTKFYQHLVQVPGWDSLPLTKAAQKVQVSAYPEHYAKHEAQAGDIIAAVHGTGPFAEITS